VGKPGERAQSLGRLMKVWVKFTSGLWGRIAVSTEDAGLRRGRQEQIRTVQRGRRVAIDCTDASQTRTSTLLHGSDMLRCTEDRFPH
jgi:hypothetical protein